MIIFVCYWEDPHQGCGPPAAAFTTEDAARAWIGERRHFTDYTYTELDLDFPPIYPPPIDLPPRIG